MKFPALFLALTLIATGGSLAQRPADILPPEVPRAARAEKAPSLEELDAAFNTTSLGKSAMDARLHLQWRELWNRTANEPDLVSVRAAARAARTELEKRRLYRAFYKMLFDRMRARANTREMKEYLTARETEQLALLAQPRVRPAESATPP